jgi:hypothetical protein
MKSFIKDVFSLIIICVFVMTINYVLEHFYGLRPSYRFCFGFFAGMIYYDIYKKL